MIEYEWGLERQTPKDYEFNKYCHIDDLKLYICFNDRRVEADNFNGDMF